MRKYLRLTRTDYRRYGIPAVLVTYAYDDGGPVPKDAASGLALLRLACGVQVATRWGSVMVQWRGFDRG